MSGLEIEGKTVEITNPDRMMFPQEGVTKGQMIDYYIRHASYILPWLRGRPFSMVPYPDGVQGKFFYQKQCPENAPDWLERIAIASARRGHIDWCLVNDLPSMVFMANRACIEMHAWFSRTPRLGEPDVAIFDLDPSGNTGFADAAAAARLIRIALDDAGLISFVKTSGATGLHVVIPIEPTPYKRVQAFLGGVCRLVERADPDRFTTERTIARRGDRVYLDAAQNARGKTIPAPYSLRATARATFSAPVTWQEVDGGVDPESFRMDSVDARLAAVGDLFAPLYGMAQRLPS